MTIRYVGIGGNNGNNGLSWDTRKLTLNGVEDTPVVAGDIVYVGAGVYREMLTLDVSGTNDSTRVTYIGDVTGENTDHIGGTVRITTSDDDITNTRNNCITDGGNSRSYRTFRGFSMGAAPITASYHPFTLTSSTSDYVIVEDCSFHETGFANAYGFYISSRNCIVRRCYFQGIGAAWFGSASRMTACNNLVENCIIIGGNVGVGVVWQEGNYTKNCTIVSCTYGFYIVNGTASNVQLTVTNSIITLCRTDIHIDYAYQLSENYNNSSDITATRAFSGANDNDYTPIFQSSILYPGISYGITNFVELSEYSPLKAIVGTNEATTDFYGMTRPTTSGKKSWGAIQYDNVVKDGTTKYSGNYSLKFKDAGRKQLIITGTSAITTVTSIKVYRDSNYTGTYPQMIIKQPGQSDRTTTDTGSSGTWNTLTDSFTPATYPPYIIVELVSNNTATSGSYAVYFDSLSSGGS
jgi:hypothetical protein